MAESVHLFIKANGVTIKGDSTLTSEGRSDSIECQSFEWAVNTAREQGTATAIGRRQMEPIVIQKRIDRASPLLAKALFENQEIEATFTFHRPSRKGDGSTENFYNVVIERARLAGMRQLSPSSAMGLSAHSIDAPPTEEVSFVFHTIEMTYTDGGISHRDTWDAPR